MSPTLMHSILIIFTLTLSFLFSKSFLAQYDLQLSAILFIFLYFSKRIYRSDDTHLLESIVFTFVIATVVNTTGGLSSPFFFLVYFLLFSLSLFLEPVVSIVTTITFVLFFLISMSPTSDLRTLMPIFSLAFLTPFAMFLGQEYLRVKTLENREGEEKKDAFMFLSLVIKNHVKAIRDAAENFTGDHHLDEIKKNAQRMEKLIDDYEQKS